MTCSLPAERSPLYLPPSSNTSPKREKKQKFLKTIPVDLFPVRKQQPGYLQILPFVPELENEKILVVTL